MNTVLKLKRGPSTNLGSLPVEDGSLIITKDKHQIYFDVGADRVPVGHEMATDDDILAVFNGGTAISSTEPESQTTTTVINGADEITLTDF